MKWISNPKTNPKLGDKRYVMKFAFLPVYAWSFNDNLRYLVWLEYYKQEQYYKEIYEYYSGIGVVPIDRWIKINNYIK